jgi:hypothetical protein
MFLLFVLSILHAAAKWLAVDGGLAEVAKTNLYIPGGYEAHDDNIV